MRKYIGTSTISNMTKNRKRSSAQEHAEAARLEQQQPGVVRLGVVVRVDAEDGEREQQAGEHDEEQRDAVDAQVPARCRGRRSTARLVSNWKPGVVRSRSRPAARAAMAPVAAANSSATSRSSSARRRGDQRDHRPRRRPARAIAAVSGDVATPCEASLASEERAHQDAHPGEEVAEEDDGADGDAEGVAADVAGLQARSPRPLAAHERRRRR